MSSVVCNMIGYPEPVHFYLGKSSIIAFTAFPKVQHISTEQKSISKYDSNLPLKWDVEFRAPFKEKDNQVIDYMAFLPSEEWHLVQNVDLETATKHVNDFLQDWCAKYGLKLV